LVKKLKFKFNKGESDMKFKVGDKVRVINNITDIKAKDDFIGKIYTIQNTQGVHSKYGQRYGIGEEYVVYEQELELTSFTKANLQSGMVVECRGGDRLLVLGDKLICDKYWFSLGQFANDLSSSSDKYTIDKIYQAFGYNFTTLFADNYLTLIWEREKSAKKMTVAEIEKELGYKVEIVSEN
jgi:hypothetical protein